MNILLADDDEEDCLFFTEALQSLDKKASLETVSDGEELMKRLRFIKQSKETLPDIIYLDLNMRRKSGLECLAEMRGDENLRHIPVIIYSTSAPQEIMHQLSSLGANHYMQKPAAFTDLQRLIDKSLRNVSGSSRETASKKFVISIP